MGSSSEPDIRFLETRHATQGSTSYLALLIPTTRSILDCKTYQLAELVIGTKDEAQRQVSPQSALRSLIAANKPKLLFVHSDQLVSPQVANILVRLEHSEVYISAIEYLLCSRHGYRLGAWTREGWIYLPPGSSIDDVARLVVRHLRDCATITDGWQPSVVQAHRLHSHRKMRRERMVRFVCSSIAYAFRNTPQHGRARELFSDVYEATAFAVQGASE